MKQTHEHHHQQQQQQQPDAPSSTGATPKKKVNNNNSNRNFDYEYAQQELRVATIAALSQQIKGRMTTHLVKIGGGIGKNNSSIVTASSTFKNLSIMGTFRSFLSGQ